MLNKLH